MHFLLIKQKNKGTEIVFTEGVGIVMHQIAVTYEHNDEWTGKNLSLIQQPLIM